MITQQEIVDRVNDLTLHYHVSWESIKYDADKAIAKINSFVGTKFPTMSSILTSPTVPYAFRSGADADGPLDTLYFEDEHIHSVIIPYIAMEILARDEEFTTVYNKYQLEVEDGLFSMFQKVFNRVPLDFRQDPDQGVFFGSDSALAAVAKNDMAHLPVYTFKVHYHVNQDDIVLGEGIVFVRDTRAYTYQDTAVVKGWNYELLSASGALAYQFTGWTSDGITVRDPSFAVGTEIVMVSDVHYYATWDVKSTLTNTPEGVLNIKNEYKHSLVNLVIPNIVDNNMVRTIPTNFLLSTAGAYGHADRIMSIELPDFLTEIEPSAFNAFQGDEIIFPDTVVDNLSYGGIRIGAAAFVSTPNLTGIILPVNVRTVLEGAFPIVNGKEIKIYVESLIQNKPQFYAGDTVQVMPDAFDELLDYAIGDEVTFDDMAYVFTAEHLAGPWLYLGGEAVAAEPVFELVEGTSTGWQDGWAVDSTEIGDPLHYVSSVVWGYNG